MIFDKIEKRDISLNDWKGEYSLANGYETTPFSGGFEESSYFGCVKVISEDVAKCPLQVKQETERGEILAKDHYLFDILRLRFNEYMNAIDSIKTFVALSKHNGISGLYIDRQGVKVKGLYPVSVTGKTTDNAGLIKSTKSNKILWDFVGVDGEMGSAFDRDVILLKDFTLDGINTKAIKNILNQSLDTSTKAQAYLNTMFTNGMTNKLAVQLTSDVKDEKELKKIQAKFDRIYSNNGKVFTIPAGYTVSPLNISLADAQYVELRKLSKEEIAMAFKVPLSKLGIVRDTAISEEQDNLKFLSDCLSVIFQSIEQEMDWKLLTSTERKKGYKIRFNINSLLRTDATTQASVINSYVKTGVYSLNQAKSIVGVEELEQDVTLFPSGQVTLEALQLGEPSYIDNTNVKDNIADKGGEQTDGNQKL